MEPGNRTLSKGIWNSQKRMQTGQIQEVRKWIDAGLSVMDQHKGLLELKSELDAGKAQIRKTQEAVKRGQFDQWF